MVITDSDMWTVLTEYRRLRKDRHLTPAEAMAIVRDSYAGACLPILQSGGYPEPSLVRRWAAADVYARSVIHRPAYWHHRKGDTCCRIR